MTANRTCVSRYTYRQVGKVPYLSKDHTPPAACEWHQHISQTRRRVWKTVHIALNAISHLLRYSQCNHASYLGNEWVREWHQDRICPPLSLSLSICMAIWIQCGRCMRNIRVPVVEFRWWSEGSGFQISCRGRTDGWCKQGSCHPTSLLPAVLPTFYLFIDRDCHNPNWKWQQKWQWQSTHTQGKCDFVCPLLSLLDGAGHGSTSCKSGNHTCPVLSSSSSLHFAPASASSSPASVEQEQSPVPTLSSSGHPWEVGRPSSPLTVIHSTPHHSAGLRLPPAARHLPPAALAPSIRLPLLKLWATAFSTYLYLTLTTYPTQVHRSRTVQHFHLQYN